MTKCCTLIVQVPRYEENVRGEEMKKLRSDIISIFE